MDHHCPWIANCESKSLRRFFKYLNVKRRANYMFGNRKKQRCWVLQPSSFHPILDLGGHRNILSFDDDGVSNKRYG
jgi:hypothetical protein